MFPKYITSSIITVIFAVLITHIANADLGEGRWIHHVKQGPSERIQAVFPGVEGERYTLWAATYGSLHAYDGTYWKKLTYEDQGLVEHIPFFRDSKGRFYFERDGALFILDDGIITIIEDSRLSNPIVGSESLDGTIYFGTYNINRNGLFRLDNDSLEKLDTMRIKSLTFDNEGNMWATGIEPDTDNTVLVMRNDGLWQDRTEEIADILPLNKGDMTIQTAPDGTMWLSSRDGHGRYSDGTWETWSEESRNGAGPLFLEFDANGTVWGYDYGHLYRLDPETGWEVVFEPSLGTVNRADFLTVDVEGHVITFDDCQLYYQDVDTWRILPNPNDLSSDMVSCVMYDKVGKIVCGHALNRYVNPSERDNYGISVFDGEHWMNYTVQNDIFLWNVYSMRKIFDDDIVAYTDAGLKTFDGQNWHAFADTLKGDYIRDIIEDPSGPLWIATDKGLLEYYHSVDVPSYTTHIHPQNISGKKNLYQLNFDPEGKLYMLTDFGSIVFYDTEDEWLTHTSSSQYTKDIAIEDDGRLWASRVTAFSWWDVVRGWQDVVEFDEGWLAEIDDQGRVWGSGYGATGYYEDGAWYTIEELIPHASSSLAVSGDGRYALNSFDIDFDDYPGERDRTDFYGIWEFVPGAVSVEDTPEPLPALSTTAYPNPFNPSTTIQFTIPDASKVTLSVYNISGQKVATIADGFFTAGVHNVQWNAITSDGAPCSSGIYLYRIRTDYANSTGKLVLMR